MRAVVQRVTQASVTVEDQVVGEIAEGLMVLVAVRGEDTEQDMDYIAKKIAGLRVFSDEAGKMNLSVMDTEGDILVVSQFTLCANYAHGNRPDFLNAAAPNEANRLYEYFCSLCESEISHVGRGIFGADMELTIVNDGPVTIVMDSNVLLKKNTQ